MVGGSRKQNVPGSNGPGPLRQILVAIDGSDSSLRAVAMAAEIAKPFDAKLVVISVASLPEYTLMDYYRGGTSPAVTELMRKARTKPTPLWKGPRRWPSGTAWKSRL